MKHLSKHTLLEDRLGGRCHKRAENPMEVAVRINHKEVSMLECQGSVGSEARMPRAGLRISDFRHCKCYCEQLLDLLPAYTCLPLFPFFD